MNNKKIEIYKEHFFTDLSNIVRISLLYIYIEYYTKYQRFIVNV